VRSEAAVLMVALVLAGCSGRQSVLSERFDVCMHPDRSIRLHDMRMGPDFDMGSIEIDHSRVGVYVGWHPNVSHAAMRKGVDAVGGFRFLSKERTDGVDKILVGYNRGDRRGPVFVLFETQNIEDVENVLLSKGFLVDCEK
jgi:hypothetical protein